MDTHVKVNYDELGYTPREIQQKRRTQMCYVAQKLFGAIMLVLAILIPFIMAGDATPDLLFVPMGLYLLFTTEKVVRLW